MKTEQEIKNGILENCVNEYGDIDLSGLDFSDFDGNIIKGSGKIKYNLYQYSNKVKGDLYQHSNEVEGNLGQHSNEVQGKLIQGDNKVEGSLGQGNNKVKGRTYNDFDNHAKVVKLENGKGITDLKPETNYEGTNND